jgi:two-component system sensor histidine kinase HydH
LDKPGAVAGDPGRLLLDYAPTGVIAVDADARVLAINTIAERLLKLTAVSVIGAPSSQLPEPVSDWIQEAFERGNAAEPVCSIGGEKFLAHITASRGGEGQVTGVLVEFQNAIAAKSITDNLEHLDQLAGLGAVTAGVAHEIKNALVAVRTFFDLAGLGENDPELRNVAAGEVVRIEKTVRQLLRGAKREQLRTVPLSVHALVQDAVNLLRHELQTRAIQLTTHFSAPTDRVNGDERQLRHALVNVLLNAVEAIGSTGQLTIVTEIVQAWERKHLRVSVRDSGPGIPADILDKLFNPFFTTKSDGTGLGLPISQRILQAHNGAVTVESEFGNGATFHLFLPLI